MKDAFNALDPRGQPGPLAKPLGGGVEQYYALEDEVAVSGGWGSGRASIWAELLSTKSSETEIVMRYGVSNGWLDGQPAAITRRVGKGRITYIGALLDTTVMEAAIKWMLRESSVQAAFGPVPAGVEVCRRVGEDRTVFVLLNHSSHPVQVTLPRPMLSLLIANAQVSTVALPVEGVDVLEVH